uniref:Cytochrome c oxidase subunit 3 n=1 Tax=Runaria punctata TaxID=2950364 RepID=A0A977XTM5_9HYME|nr:cytochrome c oxidase subunit III [Runaria punctata]UXW93352.1 cytochrome c oxidase subunit III [Runaria punctata]
MIKLTHPFHLVDKSPWPLLSSLALMSMLIGSINWMTLYNNQLMIMSFLTLNLILYQWWRDITRESTYQGLHTLSVSKGLRWGMILFIISEIFFFISFFWSFFHSALSPSIEIGSMWPPKGIEPFNPLHIPLLNTILLLSSGVTITWTHHSLMNSDINSAKKSLLITISLGVIFSLFQLYEYYTSPFTISSSVYGSTFFMATGFHGLHVLIGTTFLLINLLRINMNHLSSQHHFSFEAAAWYWHFVDIIWLFLYISIYWWYS